MQLPRSHLCCSLGKHAEGIINNLKISLGGLVFFLGYTLVTAFYMVIQGFQSISVSTTYSYDILRSLTGSVNRQKRPWLITWKVSKVQVWKSYMHHCWTCSIGQKEAPGPRITARVAGKCSLPLCLEKQFRSVNIMSTSLTIDVLWLSWRSDFMDAHS